MVQYYVNPVSGKNTNSGTQESAPFKTIAYALGQVRTGDRIQLAPGTYSAASGEAFPLIVLDGVTVIGNETKKGEGILIEGSGVSYPSPLKGGSKPNVTIWIEGNNIQLLGITVTNSNPNGVGVWIESPAQIAPTVKNCTFTNCGKDEKDKEGVGIAIIGGASPKISDNIIKLNKGYGITVSPGIINSEIARPVLLNNIIEQNFQDGLWVQDIPSISSKSQPILGTIEKPGGNLLRGNCRYDLQNTSTVTLSLFGNQIDPARVTGKVILDKDKNTVPAPLPCPKDPSTYTLSGHVSDRTTKQPIANLKVEATFSDGTQTILTRTSTTNASGGFSLPFDRALFQGGRKIRVSFQVYQGEQLLPTETAIENLQPANQHIEIEVALPSEQYRVKGQVRQADDTPLNDVTVRAFDRDLRHEELLGETSTDPEGYYEIGYNRNQFRRAEKGNADLIVRAYPQGKPLVESPTLFNAKAVETVDLIVSLEPPLEPSEYEKLDAELMPLLEGEGVLPANLTAADIAFLVGETGCNPQYTTFWSLATKLAQKTNLPNLPAEVFYGFARENLPTELPSLLAQSPQVQRQALETAMQDKIIPALSAQQLENILQQLQTLFAQQQEPGGVLTNPAFLFNPEVFFLGNLKNLGILNLEQAEFITAKLNDRLHRELLNRVGTVSEAMFKVLQTGIAQIDYPQVKDSQLSAVLIQNILPEVKKDEKLAQEATEIEKRLAQNPPEKVSDVLYLNAPLKANPIIESDLRIAQTLGYAQLANLDKTKAKTIIDKNLQLETASEAVWQNLVSEGILNEQQKVALQLAVDLGKLTDGNQTVIASLKVEGVQSPSALISWEQTKWEQFITDKTISLPPGETVQTYATNILFNLERTYPSQFLFTHLLKTQTTGISDTLLGSLNYLLDNNDKLIDGTKPASINWANIPEAERQQRQQELQGLTGLANSYRHLGITDLINDKTLDLANKKSAINTLIQSFATFYQNNSSLDLRSVNFFALQAETINWQGIPDADRPLVRKQLMAYQRLLSLEVATSDRQKLLNKGYDSAAAIASTTQSEFVNNSGLELGKARMLYARSQETSMSVSHHFGAIWDTVRGQFNEISMANLSPNITNELRDIDGFADLFGPQNFCDCEECKSILSPAAYFVDLMHFVEKHVPKTIFLENIDEKKNEPSLYLRNRRPDLWKLNLTCENTHTLVPYLTIVDEVLETYLTVYPYRDIYEKLSQKCDKISFALPFNLPLEELRIYLSHFGVSLHEIYKTLKHPDDKVWRARVNLSQEEFDIITTLDPDGVMFRFGKSSSFNEIDVQDFIRITSINRQQLDELLAQKFNTDMQQIAVDKNTEPDELQNFSEILINLNNDRLDFIHRFIRLWQKTSWSIPELDLILTFLKDANLIQSDLNDRAVLYIAQLVDLQEKLKLTVEELCSMFHQLPVSKEFPKPPARESDRRLYEHLFDLKNIFGVKDPNTGEINSSVVFHHYSLNTVNPDDATIDPKTPLLLSGLGISETELLLLFDLLKQEMDFDNNGDCHLTLKKISLLYRHTRLAKALKFKIDDFIQALKLIFSPDSTIIKRLAQIDELIEFRAWLKSSPFSVAKLRFILTGEESNTVKYKNNLETVGKIVQEFQKAQTLNQVTLEIVGKIVQEIQNSQAANKVEALKHSLSNLFNLTAIQLTDILNNRVTIKINSTEIQSALNTIFTDGIPNNPQELLPLLDLVQEIERILIMQGIVQEVQKSQVTNKLEPLKDSLLKLFNLTSPQLVDLLKTVYTDINSQEILTALNTSFTDDGIPNKPEELLPLFNLVREIEVILKTEALKVSLAKVFNLTSNQLKDILQWISIDINNAEILKALDTTFTNGKPNNPENLTPLLDLVKQIERVLFAFNNLKFKEQTVSYLTQKPLLLVFAPKLIPVDYLTKVLTLDYLKAMTFYKELIALDEEVELSLQVMLDNYRKTSQFSDLVVQKTPEMVAVPKIEEMKARKGRKSEKVI